MEAASASLIDYQREILDTIKRYQSGALAVSWVPFYSQGTGFIVPISDVSIVHLMDDSYTPLPGNGDIAPGVSSMGGDLFTVIDFAVALTGKKPLGVRQDNWLIALSRRVAQGIALQVTGTLTSLPDNDIRRLSTIEAAAYAAPPSLWCDGVCIDSQDQIWHIVDLKALIKTGARTHGGFGETSFIRTGVSVPAN
jgi:chemotaxis signal transduction protein